MLKKTILMSTLGLTLLGTCFVANADQIDATTLDSSAIQTRAIDGKITINGTTYKWKETSFGKNRGITFNPGNHKYQLSPNPHKDPWYNKNQKAFYNYAAEEIEQIGNEERWATTNWPSVITGINVHNKTYTLTER